jgi:long-chain acyl-CoA synthetase
MGCSNSRDSNLYTKEVTTTEGKPEKVFRTAYLKELQTEVKSVPDMKNLQEYYLHCFDTYAKNQLHGTRVKNADGTFGDYEWITYEEVEDIALRVGLGMEQLKLVEPVKGEEFQETFKFVAIYAKNREEWSHVDIASCLFGFTVIPLYDTLGPEAMNHIFNQTQVSTVCASGDNAEKLIKGFETGNYKSL